jgi:hypothetical protein
MVTMQKMFLITMDNRVAKSEVMSHPETIGIKSVKVQRVNGNLNGNSVPFIRCNLMCFEKNYQEKIPNQINKCLFSTVSNINNNIILSKIKLNPLFLTGFSDAESSFSILIQPRSDSKTK